MPKGKTDWKKLQAISDVEIAASVKDDPDAPPMVDAEWFKTAKITAPESKKHVSIRLDTEVVKWFKSHGRGYQTRINALLRAYMDSHRHAGR
ncbi:MAG: BrnA antitoxin family protein [Nitrospinae bacterium]|nr:BrnA antitoxin family protein [Nitrospinota bacterium]